MTLRPSTTPAPEANWLALLPVARELERWVNALPDMSPDARDSREEFPGQQRKGEAELMARLRRMPGCSVMTTPRGLQATLRLAGVEVTSYSGLIGACREWIATVRDEALRQAQAAR